MKVRPYIATFYGAALGVALVVVWMLTLDPHGGRELSGYLFPISAFVLKRAYDGHSIPVLLWYGGAFGQWVLLGLLVDLARMALSARAADDRQVHRVNNESPP